MTVRVGLLLRLALGAALAAFAGAGAGAATPWPGRDECRRPARLSAVAGRRAALGRLREAGGVLPHHRSAGHDHYRHQRPVPLPGSRQQPGASLRHRRRPRGLHLVGPAEDSAQAGMAGLASAAGNDRAPALSAAVHGRRSGQSARRARDVSRRAPSIAFTAPTSRRRSDTPSRRAAFVWSTTT